MDLAQLVQKFDNGMETQAELRPVLSLIADELRRGLEAFLVGIYLQPTAHDLYTPLGIAKAPNCTVRDLPDFHASSLRYFWAKSSEITYIPDINRSPDQGVVEIFRESLKAGSLLIVRLDLDGEVLGAIVIVREANQAQPTPDDFRLIQGLARQASLGVLNARLQQNTQRRLRSVTALTTIEKALAGSLDLRTTLEIIIDQGMNLLGIDAMSVLLLNQYSLRLEYHTGKGFRSRNIQQTGFRLGEGLAGRAGLERRVVGGASLILAASGSGREEVIQQERFVVYYAAPIISQGVVRGVVEVFSRTSIQADSEWLTFLDIFTRKIALAITDAEMYKELQQAKMEIAVGLDQVLEAWVQSLDRRNGYAEGHSLRLAEACVHLGRAIGVSEHEVANLRRGALLHDLGMLRIPEHIIQKKGPLNAAEWDMIYRHPIDAYEMITTLQPLMGVDEIPYCHHENFDGSGYPRNLKGEAIPLGARIFRVVDVWSALRVERPFRQVWSEREASQYLHEQAGKLFDPMVVREFIELL